MARQVRDILHSMRATHQRLSELYAAHALDADEQSKLRRMLEFLSGHEQRLAGELALFAGTDDRRVLDMWVNNPPCCADPVCLDPLALRADMSLEDALEVVLGMDECIRGHYQQLADNTVYADVREVFLRLAEQEHREECAATRSVMELERGI